MYQKVHGLVWDYLFSFSTDVLAINPIRELLLLNAAWHCSALAEPLGLSAALASEELMADTDRVCRIGLRKAILFCRVIRPRHHPR
jgi:hypothetical protein